MLQPYQHCFSLMFFLSFNNKDKSDKSTFLITSWFQLSHRWTGYRLPRPAGKEIEILICQIFQSHTVSSLPWTSTAWWSCHRRQWQGAGGRWGRRQHSWHTGHDVKWQHCIPSACDSWQFLLYDCTLIIWWGGVEKTKDFAKTDLSHTLALWSSLPLLTRRGLVSK